MAVIRGTDVSVWQNAIDFAKMSALARFTFIRATYGASLDTRFKLNWANAKGKLQRGAYLYYLPNESGVAQANALIAALDSDFGELPVAIDLEQDAVAPWTLDMVASLKACISAIAKATGRMPLIYTSAGYYNPHLGSATFGCDLWVAFWSAATIPLLPSAWTTYKFWQTGSKGNGFAYGANSQFIDEDIANFTESEWQSYIGKEPQVVTIKSEVTDATGAKFIGVQPFTFKDVPDVPVPPVPPAPATWHIEFYRGQAMAGTPILSVDKPEINYPNGAALFEPGLPADDFSARATRKIWFAAGTYEATMSVDDGGRVKMDGNVIIESWKVQAYTAYKAQFTLTQDGTHDFVVEYFEATGWQGWGVTILPYTAPVPPPIPPTPPPAVTKVQVGMNTLADGGSLRDAYTRGCRYFLVMQDWDSATWLADQPGTIVMYRQWTDYAISSAEQQVGALKGATHPKIIYVGPNEGDWGYGWGSPAEIQRHAELDRDVAAIIKAHSGARYAGLTSAVGNPDFTRQDICDAFKAYYAPLWNAGLIDIDMHLYSPDMAHLYKGPSETIWHETRWQFLFTKCGFDPNSPSRIYSGEMGMDEGGTGGFPAHNASDADVVKYCQTWLAIQSAPFAVNGVMYKSPVVGGAIFQAGNTAGRWDGYACQRYFPAIQASGVWTAKARVWYPGPAAEVAQKQAAIDATIDYSMIRTARGAVGTARPA